MLQLLEKDRKMDIFTDASLNDKKKIAGVSAIFVPSQSSGTITSYNSYCSVNKIETAELLAIAISSPTQIKIFVYILIQWGP